MFGARPGFGGPGGPAGVATAPKVHDVQGAPDDCISRVRWSGAQCPVQLLGACGWDKTCRVWQVQAQGDQVMSTPMAMMQHTMPLLDLSFANDGRAFYGGCCKSAVEWNLQTNQTRQVAAHDLPVSCLEYLPLSQFNPEMLITCGWDGKVKFWDLRQQSPVKEESLGGPIMCMDAKTTPMATFCTGRKIFVYNLQTMSVFNQLEPHNMMKYGFRAISNLKNQQGFLTGSSEGRVAVVPLSAAASTQTNNNISCCFKAHCVEGQQKNVYTMYPTNFVAVHPEANCGVSGGGDGYVRFWSLSSKSRTYELAPRQHNGQNVPCSSGDINANGTLVAYAASYDWSMGKQGFDPTQPRAVSILPVNPQWTK